MIECQTCQSDSYSYRNRLISHFLDYLISLLAFCTDRFVIPRLCHLSLISHYYMQVIIRRGCSLFNWVWSWYLVVRMHVHNLFLTHELLHDICGACLGASLQFPSDSLFTCDPYIYIYNEREILRA